MGREEIRPTPPTITITVERPDGKRAEHVIYAAAVISLRPTGWARVAEARTRDLLRQLGYEISA